MNIESALDTLYFLCIGPLPPIVSNLTLKGTETVNGQPAYVIEGTEHIPARQFTSAKGKKVTVPEENSIWKWWIDKKSFVLARIEARLPNIPQAVYMMEKKKRVQKVITISVIRHQTILFPKPNQVLDDKLFIFTPPPGATDTTSGVEKLLHGK